MHKLLLTIFLLFLLTTTAFAGQVQKSDSAAITEQNGVTLAPLPVAADLALAKITIGRGDLLMLTATSKRECYLIITGSAFFTDSTTSTLLTDGDLVVLAKGEKASFKNVGYNGLVLVRVQTGDIAKGSEPKKDKTDDKVKKDKTDGKVNKYTAPAKANDMGSDIVGGTKNGTGDKKNNTDITTGDTKNGTTDELKKNSTRSGTKSKTKEQLEREKEQEKLTQEIKKAEAKEERAKKKELKTDKNKQETLKKAKEEQEAWEAEQKRKIRQENKTQLDDNFKIGKL